MFLKPSLIILAVIGLPLVAHAQDKDAPPPIRIRAVLHDPVHPSAELFYPDKSGAVLPLEFRPQDLTEPLLMQPVNGSLVLYDKAAVDPEKPQESLACSIKLPPDLKQAIMLVMPTQNGAKSSYQMMLIDDSPKAFPGGESKVLSLVKVDVAVQAGEHKVPVHPGKLARVPAVTKVNDYLMAQTNFYYRQDDAWMVFAERQLHYQNVCRRLFIVHATPGAVQPTVTTIVDVSRGAEPQ